jgi:hypothetical protein
VALGQSPVLVASGVTSLIRSVVSIVSMIGKGRKEADAIVPVQNGFGNLLVQVNNAIATATVPELQAMAAEVENGWNQFRQFVAGPQFTDGRASTQALNTIGPLVDGSSGYASKTGTGVILMNAGPLGPGGSSGTLGSIAYAVQLLYGADPTSTHNALSSNTTDSLILALIAGNTMATGVNTMLPGAELTQNAGSGIPNLQTNTPSSFPLTAQPGTLQPVYAAPLPQPNAAYSLTPESSGLSTPVLIGIGILAFLLLRR